MDHFLGIRIVRDRAERKLWLVSSYCHEIRDKAMQLASAKDASGHLAHMHNAREIYTWFSIVLVTRAVLHTEPFTIS